VEFNGTHQLMVYAEDVNVFSANTNVIGNNTEALLEDKRKLGLKVNTVETKNMVVSRHRSAGQNHT
jgi:hypothetical protein